MRFSLVEFVNLCYGALGGTATADVSERLKDVAQRRRIIKATKKALDLPRNPLTLRKLGQLLDEDWFVQLITTPGDAGVQARAESVPHAELERFFGADADERELRQMLALLLANVWSIAAKDRTIADSVLLSQSLQASETGLAILNYAIDTYVAVETAISTIEQLEERLFGSRRNSVLSAGFVAEDVDWTTFRMGTAHLGGRTPVYIERDIDRRLDERLRRSDDSLVVIAGPLKSGKTRCALEALGRSLPHAIVFPVRRVPGEDNLRLCLDLFRDAPRDEDDNLVLLVDELDAHLPNTDLTGNVGLARAARVKIVATCDDLVVDLDDSDIRIRQLNHDDLLLLDQQAEYLPSRATTTEQERFVQHYPDLRDLAAHFPAGFAAVEQITKRVKNVFKRGQPTATRRALLLGGWLLASTSNSREIPLEDLRRVSKEVYSRLEARPIARLENSELESALRWSHEQVGGPYAVLQLLTGGDDDYVELSHAGMREIAAHTADADLTELFADRDALQIAANLHLGSRVIGAARQWYKRAIATSHGDVLALALYGLADLEAKHGSADEAREWYRRLIAIAHSQYSPEAANSLGILEESSGETASASKWYEYAFRHGPTARARAVAASNLGYLRHISGDLESARSWYLFSLEEGTVDAAVTNIGVVEKELGNVTEARRRYAGLVRSGSPAIAAQAAYNLGNLEWELGRIQEAVKWYTFVGAGVDRRHACSALVNLSGIHMSNAAWNDARVCLTSALAKDNGQLADAIRFNLAVVHQHLGEVDQAREQLRAVIEGSSAELRTKAERLLASL